MNLDALALMLLAVLQTVPTSEYRERRERLLARHADGIVLIHARSTAAGLGAHGFKQDASFFYRNCLPLWVDQGDGGVVGSTKD